MSDTSTLICKSCGGNTEVAANATQHECKFCGAAIIVQATLEARGEAERAARQRLGQIEEELEGLHMRAKLIAAQGDTAQAEQLLRQKVEREGQIYQETGYYRILGLDTAESVAKHHDWQVSFERDQLRGPDGIPLGQKNAGNGPGAAQDSPLARFNDAMVRQDLDALLTSYPEVCRQKMATSPEWQDRPDADLRDAIAHAIEDMVRNLSWASPEELAQRGYRVALAEAQPDGSQALTCGGCNVQLTLSPQQERISCEHCGTLTLVRLSGLQKYHAMGYTDVTQEQADNQQDAELWSVKGDLGALIRMSRRMIDAEEVTPGAPKEQELTFTYAMMTGGEVLSAEQHAAVSQQLGLEPPLRCSTCEQEIALSLEGSGRCPLCESLIRKPAPATAKEPTPAKNATLEPPAPSKSWWQFWK